MHFLDIFLNHKLGQKKDYYVFLSSKANSNE